MDNLESQTYEVFEKDPIKYSQYQQVRQSDFFFWVWGGMAQMLQRGLCLSSRHTNAVKLFPLHRLYLGRLFRYASAFVFMHHREHWLILLVDNPFALILKIQFLAHVSLVDGISLQYWSVAFYLWACNYYPSVHFLGKPWSSQWTWTQNILTVKQLCSPPHHTVAHNHYHFHWPLFSLNVKIRLDISLCM